MLRIIETIDNGYYDTHEVFECSNCGRQFTLGIGADPDCPCSYEEYE